MTQLSFSYSMDLKSWDQAVRDVKKAKRRQQTQAQHKAEALAYLFAHRILRKEYPASYQEKGRAA